MAHFCGDGDWADDPFVQALNRCVGDRLRAEGPRERYASSHKYFAARVWTAMQEHWVHENGDTASYGWRAASDAIRSIVGAGDSMDWYDTWADGADEVIALLAKEGWAPESQELQS